MEKPNSMSVKDWIIKKMSKDLTVSERINNAVITHQFDSANNALKNNNTVELYNFGKFTYNVKKARIQLEKHKSQKNLFEDILKDESLSEERRKNAGAKHLEAIKNIDAIKIKLKDGDV